MNILAIDTSNKTLGLAITSNDNVLGEITLESINKHSVYAMPKIVELFEKTSITIDDINRIVVANGPGSYTGLRIGLTIGKTIAWAKNIPLITLSSLKALALSVTDYDYVIPLFDAKRENYFIGIYDKNYNSIIDDQIININSINKHVENLEGRIAFVGEDLDKYEDILGTYGDIVSGSIIPSRIALYGQGIEEISNTHSIVPNYIKKTQAEIDLESK